MKYCLFKNKNTNSSFHSSILASQSFHRHTYVDLQLPDGSLFKSFKQYFNWLSGIICCLFFLASCTISKQIGKQANQILLKDPVINSGHTGISIYEPATNKYWYNYDATKYFVPASNVKLFTLYAGMKYLGDSIIGLRYQQKNNELIIYPTGDPTFLHPDFKQQLVFDFLKGKSNIVYSTQKFSDALGKGWAWNDYLDNYMVERSEFPIYGNLIRVYRQDGNITIIPKKIHLEIIKEPGFVNSPDYSLSRKWDSNDLILSLVSNDPIKDNYEIPLVNNWYEVSEFLKDTLHQKISLMYNVGVNSTAENDKNLQVIYSQPTDSLFKPMMYNSDNFFAEQTLLMVSNEHIGYMNDEAIIDTLLKTDLRGIPQKPRWVDGSGLSRYNLFSPQSLVYILNKMKTEFGMERLKVILPTGGTGTLKNYYQKDSSYIYAKTGSMSNHISISGFLFTKKGKELIFSILVNQFQGSATKVRRSVETFLESIREKY
jgi:D-alanyl-D-alanine carboxypeptidase/D-alanyl-D-alanine-endopeptidase (penicillin-binding protein 4)